MDWTYETVLVETRIRYETWRARVLAPLVQVASAGGFMGNELRDAVYFACSQGLLEPGEDKNQARDQFLRPLSDPETRSKELRELDGTLRLLPPASRTELTRRIWDAAVDLARSTLCGGDRIDSAEKGELVRLALALGLGAEERVRAVLGDAAQLFAIPSSASLLQAVHAGPTSRTPSTWAAEWIQHQQSAWESLNHLVNGLESAAAACRGKLDGMGKVADVPFGARSWLDQGVLVLSETPGEVWLIGDLHGDIDALEWAIRTTGIGTAMSKDTQLLFLGDYGDRGAGTLAVWLRIAELYRQFPDRIHLLRGNHEDVTPLHCKHAVTGRALTRPWSMPGTTDNESFLALGFLLQASVTNVGVVYEALPSMALFPDGTLAVHGGPLPGWKPRDGWPLSEEDKQPLQVRSLSELRKPTVQAAMRWVDVLARESTDLSWSEYGRSSRLSATGQDVRHWQETFGIRRFVHGHIHPAEGAIEMHGGATLALNTNRITGQQPAIARWSAGELRVVRPTL